MKVHGKHDNNRNRTTLSTVQLRARQDQDDQIISKVAKTAQDAVHLIELGFEYVTGEYDDGGKLFKKQKLLYLGSQSQKGL
jgi:hypothetical protein